MGIEPTSKAWEALILPLNYARSVRNDSIAVCHATRTRIVHEFLASSEWVHYRVGVAFNWFSSPARSSTATTRQ